MRSLAPLLVVLLLLAGCGDDAPEPAATDRGTTLPSPPVREPSGDAPGAQPPVDGPLPDRRTGALPMPGASCLEDPPSDVDEVLRFDGTITAVGAGGATFAVGEVFSGDVPDPVTIDLGPATTSRASESSPSYHVGTRLLVTALGTTALGCGATRYWDEATAADWRS